MPSIDELLAKRTKIKEPTTEPTKVRALAQLSNEGQLSGFGGLFKEPALSVAEDDDLRLLLTEFRKDESADIDNDLSHLRHLTKEVKAIHTQALLLHGERIKQAQELLKKYKEGAFSRWLVAAYGNRQTPYNFLQFYEFFHSLSGDAKKKAEELPRQAMYSLATRKGSMQDKQQFLVACTNATKKVLLDEIRDRFPLEKKDKRAQKPFLKLMISFAEIEKIMTSASFTDDERAILSERAKRFVGLLSKK